jgi:hypothetical protein
VLFVKSCHNTLIRLCQTSFKENKESKVQDENGIAYEARCIKINYIR